MPGRAADVPKGIGEIELVTIADPGVGVYNPNFEIEVPTGEMWRPLTLHYILTANATAANRQFVVSAVDSGAVTYWRCGEDGTTPQTATLVRRYIHSVSYGQVQRLGMDVGGGGPDRCYHCPLGEIRMLAGEKINAFFVGFQTGGAGDTFSDISLLIQKWRV